MSLPARRAILAGLALAALALVTYAHAETVQRGQLRVSFEGKLSPSTLPRSRPAAVRVSVAAAISSAAKRPAPALRQMSIAINRHGEMDASGLPVCRLDQIQPATTEDALKACRGSLVGEGRFSAAVPPGAAASFPAAGKLYAFSGELDGRPAILAHVFGTDPAPISFTLPFVVSRAKGTFGITLGAVLPKASAGGGQITGLSLNLGKTYSSHGRRHAYLSASCPTPRGIPRATFPFAKASFGFAGGRQVSSTLTRTCKAVR